MSEEHKMTLEEKSMELWKNIFISNVMAIASVDDPANYTKIKKALPRKTVQCGFDIFRVANDS